MHALALIATIASSPSVASAPTTTQTTPTTQTAPTTTSAECAGVACYERCTDAHEPAACAKWASFYKDQRESGLAELAAAPFWSAACRGGVVDSCVALASAYVEKGGLPVDTSLAAQALLPSCEVAHDAR